MKSIVFFNNKGGVGKTTLACNVVSYLTMHRNKRVLFVDADPQCNATQILLTEDEAEQIYAAGKSKSKTLYDYLSPVDNGEPQIDRAISPYLGTRNRFQTDLVPGHPKMSTKIALAKHGRISSVPMLAASVSRIGVVSSFQRWLTGMTL
ncbi:ParA family protein [Methylocystis sp. IM3]|uniref:ParA family protein n=1 Tax=unclassified Methylocystis TaxID=2625913 RepID=UPI0030FA251C